VTSHEQYHEEEDNVHGGAIVYEDANENNRVPRVEPSRLVAGDGDEQWRDST